MKAFRIAVAALLVRCSFSCSQARENSIKLAPTPPLSSGPGWAVVKGAYVRLKAKPSQAADDISHLRRGEIVEVAGRDLGSPASEADKGIWYKLKTEGGVGWTMESEVEVFATKAQAERSTAGHR
jgi:hypothetical protein